MDLLDFNNQFNTKNRKIIGTRATNLRPNLILFAYNKYTYYICAHIFRVC